MTDQLSLADREDGAKLLEKVVLDGDLASLTPKDRLLYYRTVCDTIGLNPLTKPFDFLKLDGRLVLYARKDCAEQIRVLRGVSITKLERVTTDEIHVVTAYGLDRTGRVDVASGAVSVEGLRGLGKANAMLKAETKAKRRLTLSLCGLGLLDESEIEDLPGATLPHAAIDTTTGEVLGGQAQMDERETVLAHCKDLGDSLNLGAEARLAMLKTHVGDSGHGWQGRAPVEKLKALEAALEQQVRGKEMTGLRGV